MLWVGRLWRHELRNGVGTLVPEILPDWEPGDTVRPLFSSERAGTWFSRGLSHLVVKKPAGTEVHDLRALEVSSEIVTAVEDREGALWFATQSTGLVWKGPQGWRHFGPAGRRHKRQHRS